MLTIECTGTPYQIGLTHGQLATLPISRSLTFYASKFLKACKLSWPQVQELALQYVPNIKEHWPDLLDEMQGVADGANKSLADIVALNVRTEIAFGMFSDGCTAVSWRVEGASYLGQNWDWEIDQQENLILLTITHPTKPTIKMVTEAGIIGKIGLNSSGVGVCLNAIRAKGVDEKRIPCHLGLRLVLEQRSKEEAIEVLSKKGVASSCHMLIADGAGGIGVEWSSIDRQLVLMNELGQVTHTNHFLREHPGVKDTLLLGGDTKLRLKRMRDLLVILGNDITFEQVQGLFLDEQNAPAAICRGTRDKEATTLFNVVMELTYPRAEVLMGRPCQPEERLCLSF